MSEFNMDQMVDYMIMLTSNQFKKSFDADEVESMLTSFTKRFKELYEILKTDFNATQLFHGINPAFVIALEESLPGKQGKKDHNIVITHVLTIYKAMLEEIVLFPQRQNMSFSKDPWSTFVTATKSGNKSVYDNEYFQLKEVASTNDEFAFDINRCIYQEVFHKFGRKDLGPIMCEYDSIIADNISEWVRFERDETIADGFPRCTFRYFPIEQRFSDNPILNDIYSFLKIIDDSTEMLHNNEIKDLGFDSNTNLDEIMKLYETIKNHPGIHTTLNKSEETLYGNDLSFKRFENWKKLFNRKLMKEERSKIIRELPLELKEEKINQLISDIIDNPYEIESIKWICLNYLQHHFTARVGVTTEGFDEFQLNVILEEFKKDFPKISFGSQSIDNTRVSVFAFGKGLPEYKLKEPLQQLRKRIVIDYPDVSISSIQPILSIDPIAKKFFEIFENSKQPFQLRELALRILISRVGEKLVPFLTAVAENPDDDIFLRGRVIDSLSGFTGDLPKLEKSIDNMPVPIQRAVIDFVNRYGIHEDLLIAVAKNEIITPVIRMIAIKNLNNNINPQVTAFLLDLIQNKSIDERIRQAALDSVGKHEDRSKIVSCVVNVFTDTKESSFLRMEAFETLKEIGYKKQIEIENPDWIMSMGMKQLVEE